MGITDGDDTKVGYYVGMMVRFSHTVPQTFISPHCTPSPPSSALLPTHTTHPHPQQSIFFAFQGLTVLHWARASDTLGRKPIILIGFLGLSLSMFSLGLARTFTGIITARALSGALNGNVGVVKSMMGELTDETTVARAFAWQPLPWSLGSTFGCVASD